MRTITHCGSSLFVKRVVHFAVLCSVTFSTAAGAGLIGDQVTAQWTYPPTQFNQTSVVIVGSGIELAGNWGLGHSLDIGDNYIEALLPDVTGVGSGVGWHFSSLDFGGIGGVTVSTNFTGWDNSWLSFTSNSVDVAFLGDVQFPVNEGYIRFTLQSVPVPGAVWLFGSGLLGLIGFARKRKAA